ncbi:glycosyltransferase family 2 protein [Microbacterium sp. cx-55]|uniref:glycosyltransferase family 2 protein n=1 Tax=Microbacterium sp. cx-55 TaxID=2875948 RepID=UPI001CBF27D5|nr:glycosyltransferase family A protein [Microbacterium sp. cx-55]MBZ4487093.1 glycosyltransferase family 2 protein [Microbacterium sp. cx-55]UGB36006.1 glycosyltransferase family 2 protein [Microbacterium sp. cx-55]
MSAAPRVSVVIPAYNNGRTIAETIDSVLVQDGVEFEVIIADHSSTDDTRAQMNRYADDPRVRLLDTPAGGGAPRNWNRVTDGARGELLKLVCGDDVLRPGILARQARILDDPAVALTACRRDIIDASGQVLMAGWGLRGIKSRMPGVAAVRRAVRAGSNPFGEPASVMMRTAALRDAGGWFGDFPYLIDQATYSRVLLSGDFAPDGEVGATFRMSSTQWSVALTKDQASQARGFHLWFRRHHPDALSRADVALGNARARIMARARRISYKILERRMR